MENIKSQTKSTLLILAFALALHALIQLSMAMGNEPYRVGYTDIEIYSVWAKNFSAELFRGELYPRWLTDVNAGMGQPTFFFYPPLVYYVSSLFYFPELLAAQPYLQIQLASLLGTFLSGLTFLLWMRRYTADKTAFLCSLAYMSFHYNFNIDTVMRQALAEQWSFVWMPLILIATDNLFERRRFQIPLLAITYFLLMMTHLISALIFSFALVIYFLSKLYWAEENKALPTIKFILSIALGIGLASILTLPIVELMPWVRMEIFTNGDWNFAEHFMITSESNFSLTRDISSNLWVIITPILSTVLYRRVSASCQLSNETKPLALAVLAISYFSSFMMIAISKPIWNLLPQIQMIQFPWRFFILHGLTISCIAGLYFDKIDTPKLKALPIMFFVVCCVFLLLPQSLMETNYTKSIKPLSPDQLAELDTMKVAWRNSSYVLNGELNPKTFCLDSQDSQRLSMCIINRFDSILKFKPIDSGKPNNLLKLTSHSSRDLEISYKTTSKTPLTIKRAYFHGNIAHTDKGIEIPLSYNKDGMITLTAPKGEGTITISLPYFESEKIGAAISLICLLIVTILFVFGLFRNQLAL